MVFCGCSPRETSQPSSPQVFTFGDGSVMQVQKRDGELLEGIRLVQKSPEGSQTCAAAKGRMTEDKNGQVVHVTLYDANVELPSKQKMHVDELRMDFIKEIIRR
jgi:hypothetical protein